MKFELMPETLYLMVTLLDRYLSQVKIKKNEMQLVGLTALLLASKYEDFWHPRVSDTIKNFTWYLAYYILFLFFCFHRLFPNQSFLLPSWQIKDLVSISAEAYTRVQMLGLVCICTWLNFFDKMSFSY